MPVVFDPVVVDGLVADLRNQQTEFLDASVASDQAQADAAAAVASAQVSVLNRDTQHSELEASIDALVAYVQSLK